MTDIKKILVPVDFSEPSKTAVNYGLSLALQFKGKLVLAHIVPSSTALDYTFPSENLALEREQAENAKSALASLIPAEYRDRVNLQTIVKLGFTMERFDVRSEVFGIVRDEKIDLIVMGVHGRPAIERFLLGSITERLLHKAAVPILRITHLDPTRDIYKSGPVPLRHILYATDLSDNARAGLRLSAELARTAGARLTALHVLPVSGTYQDAAVGFLQDEIKSLRETTKTMLEHSIPEDIRKDVNITPVLLEGEPSRKIIAFANEQKVDLIVMNLHGKNVVERAILGSTIERVIHSVNIPVLTVPVPTQQTAGAAA